ncbi:helix-turn-helix domain-containing protein [Celeribacter naphthalenivorans]|uniref:helix-turn-helix domain-containing protein n=1 Tax=Celeribacter naphthalenivorans TaxID=1614694 RepID=UPI001CFC4320|nr:XRE family transcriptional regulator [Celeribacter naphthalenivorans]
MQNEPAEMPKIALRAIRSEAGLSLAQTAEITGVSKAMLGQIERGESSPTLVTLWKLAKGFHLPLTAFLEGAATTPPAVNFPESIRFRTLFAFDPTLGSESFLITLAPGQTHISHPHDAGVVEDIFVTEGTLELQLGETWTRYSAGAAVRFAADQPHSYRNPTENPALFHNTMHYPRI